MRIGTYEPELERSRSPRLCRTPMAEPEEEPPVQPSRLSAREESVHPNLGLVLMSVTVVKGETQERQERAGLPRCRAEMTPVLTSRSSFFRSVVPSR